MTSSSSQKRTFCGYICVRFQLMNRNDSVSCQILSYVSIMTIIAWLREYHEIECGLWVLLRSFVADLWHKWFLFISLIFYAFAILDPRSFLACLVFWPFPERSASFCRMAILNGGDSDLPNEVCDIANWVTIHYEKDMREGIPSFGNKSSEPRFQGKWRRWNLCQVCYRPSLEYGNEQSFSFTGTWAKENRHLKIPRF